MRRRLFVAIVVVQALYLLGWAGWLEWSRAGATTIRLDVVLRDPRDLLRGDYITLGFEISNVPPALLRDPVRLGDRLWLALAADGATWRVVATARRRAALTPTPGQRLIAGTVVWADPARGARVEYGIERYYLPEDRGTIPRGRMQVDVALAPDGSAQLLRLLIDGRPYP